MMPGKGQGISTMVLATLVAVSGCNKDADNPPQISGVPEVALAQEAYFFTPEVSGGGREAFVFSVENLPSWASFDTATGTLSGIPGNDDVGVAAGIVIQASDGSSEITLGPLEIEVLAFGDRSVTVVWQPPNLNEDGSALADLAGYTVRYGRADDSLDSVIDVSNPGLTSFVVDGLVPGTYYFATTAYNSAGAESDLSDLTSGKIP